MTEEARENNGAAKQGAPDCDIQAGGSPGQNVRRNPGAFSFAVSGRLNRARYLGGQFLCGIALCLCLFVVHWGSESGNFEVTLGGSLVGAVFIVFALTQHVRRLHDVNVTGLYSLVILIPFVNFLFMLWLCFVKGTEGPNKYGSDPLTER